MDYKEIINLIKVIGKSNLSEFKLKEGDFEIALKTDKFVKYSKDGGTSFIQPIMPSHAPAFASAEHAEIDTSEASSTTAEAEEVALSADLLEIKSPIVGTFYRSSSPDKPPYIKVGDVVDAGSVVCIVEAMKLFNEIESEITGKIVKVIVEDGTPVEYDQPLFLVDPKG